MFGVAPVEYDPSTGSYRAMERFSAPTNLLWALVFAMIIFGFADHVMWILAGVLAVVLLVVELVSRRRSPSAMPKTGAPPTG